MNNFYDNIQPGPVVPPKPGKKGRKSSKAVFRIQKWAMGFKRPCKDVKGKKNETFCFVLTLVCVFVGLNKAVGMETR